MFKKGKMKVLYQTAKGEIGLLFITKQQMYNL